MYTVAVIMSHPPSMEWSSHIEPVETIRWDWSFPYLYGCAGTENRHDIPHGLVDVARGSPLIDVLQDGAFRTVDGRGRGVFFDPLEDHVVGVVAHAIAGTV